MRQPRDGPVNRIVEALHKQDCPWDDLYDAAPFSVRASRQFLSGSMPPADTTLCSIATHAAIRSEAIAG